MPDVLTLCLPEHATTVLQGLQKLQEEGFCCDVELQTNGGSIHTHSLVLAICSPYLKQRLTSSHVLYLEGVGMDALTCIVDHLYTGTMRVPLTNLTEIIQLCELLQLQETLELCKQYQRIVTNAKVESSETPAEKIGDTEKGARELEDEYRNVEAVNRKNRRKRKTPLKHSTKDDLSDLTTDSKGNELNASGMKIPKLCIAVKKRLRGRVKYLNNNRLGKTRDTVENKTGSEVDNKKIQNRKANGRKHSETVNLTYKASSKLVKTAENEEKKSLSTNVQTEPTGNASENKHSINKSRSVLIVESGIKRPINMLGDGILSSDSADRESYVAEQKQANLDANNIETVNSVKRDNVKMKKTVYPKMCPICSVQLLNYKKFVEHMKSHTLVKGSDDAEQSIIDQPQQNLPVSGGRKPRQEHWPCTVCGRVLTSAVRQACHQFSKHDIPYDQNLKLHACPDKGCKYITASKHYLQIHKQGRHGNERPHVCEFCGKGFKLPSALSTHVNIHTKEKKYECEECDQTFNQKGGLDLHVRKHHKGQSSWTELCHLCSEKFLQKTELCWHMYTVHQIPVPDRYKVFSCHLCNYETIYKNKLERHRDAHNDKRSWVCNQCGKKFVTKSYLNRHVRYHGEKSFVCEFDGCNFACVDQNGLNKHVHRMHTHKNFKPFHCSICAYKTGLRGNLDKHIRTVHNLEVVTKHTVHLKMKFKDRQSGDIITKDGQLIDDALGKGMEVNPDEEGFPGPGQCGKQVGGMDKEGTEYIAEEINKKMAEQMISLGQVGASPSTGNSDPSHSSGDQLPIGYLYNAANNYVGLYTSNQHAMLGAADSRLATQVSPQSDMYMMIDPAKFQEYY